MPDPPEPDARGTAPPGTEPDGPDRLEADVRGAVPPDVEPDGPGRTQADARGTVPVSRFRRHAYLVMLVVLPFLALGAAVYVLWGRGVGLVDLSIALVLYTVNIFGISVGYHRLLTHRAFKCVRPVRVALAVAGGLALQGPVTLWVAEHRRHHKYADRPGDPHSPWAYGESGFGLLRGLLHAQVGWFYTERRRSSRAHWVPDLLADPDIRRLDAAYPLVAAASFLLPATLGGLLSWSWAGFWTALFWAGLVRYAVVHHVTWSVNSLAHCFGDRPFDTRDRSTNLRWVALLTFGEGWHNWHHADPTCARHGVLKGHHDPSAALIRALERLGWAHDVRWPDPARLSSRLAGTPLPLLISYSTTTTAYSARTLVVSWCRASSRGLPVRRRRGTGRRGSG